MSNKSSLIIAAFAVATVLVITMVPHSALAKHDYNNNSYSNSNSQHSGYSNNNGDTRSSSLDTGYVDGFNQAQTDWNSGQYSVDSRGYNYCPSGHSNSYCKGWNHGYSDLWAEWTYNQAHGLNLANSPQQGQSSTVNVKGNNNNVTVNQGQASDSGNSDGSSNSYDSSYGSSGGGN
jgi:hypothetical protein